MNWYKKAQSIEMKEYPTPNNYLEVGHYGLSTTDEGEEFLWVWHKGQLLSEEGMNDKIHESTWPDVPLRKTYYGRYDKTKNIISINVPPEGPATFRPVPSALISMLKNKYKSPNAAVYAFSSPTHESPEGIERVANSCRRILDVN